jgi:hypothetical protein
MDTIGVALDQLPIVHLWGHANDIERYQAWDVLAELFAFVTTKRIQAVTNAEVLAHVS